MRRWIALASTSDGSRARRSVTRGTASPSDSATAIPMRRSPRSIPSRRLMGSRSHLAGHPTERSTVPQTAALEGAVVGTAVGGTGPVDEGPGDGVTLPVSMVRVKRQARLGIELTKPGQVWMSTVPYSDRIGAGLIDRLALDHLAEGVRIQVAGPGWQRRSPGTGHAGRRSGSGRSWPSRCRARGCSRCGPRTGSG